MTTEQLNKGVELRRQISRLKDLLEEFEKNDIDESPSRMTGFCIKTSVHEGYIHTIENCELEFLIDAIESRIAVLEREFERL